jgi:hypothetical protein
VDEANVQMSVEHQQHLEADPEVPRFTVIFDREGYSPELFGELWEKRIAVINYHRYPKEDWPEEEFREETVELVSGVSMKLMLAERKSVLGRNKWWCGRSRPEAKTEKVILSGDKSTCGAAPVVNWPRRGGRSRW